MPFVTAIVGAVFGVGTIGAVIAQAAIGFPVSRTVSRIRTAR